MRAKSTLSLIAYDSAEAADLGQICASIGWHHLRAASPVQVMAAVCAGAAILLIDDAISAPDRDAVLTQVRAQPGFIASIPILQWGAPTAPAMPGTRGRIVAPVTRDALIAAIEQWAGPLAAHAWRAPDNPHYRLIRLAGRSAAEPMLDRFADALEQALGADAIDRVEAHRLAGLSAMLGFGLLGASWSAVERDEPDAYSIAIAASRALLRDLRGRNAGRPDPCDGATA